MESLLPVGSIVYLKEGNVKLVIEGVCQFTNQDGKEKPVYYDYVASQYPAGLDVDNVFYFNTASIDQVVFEGYKSEDHDRYLQVVKEWATNHPDDFEIGEV
ncbi:MAG: DUF4176 domain-containing protein [Lachnospiraceae bacterium]|nr:DUF4176 domain-containing protein [Lachnospiraceae bacterium]